MSRVLSAFQECKLYSGEYEILAIASSTNLSAQGRLEIYGADGQVVKMVVVISPKKKLMYGDANVLILFYNIPIVLD